MGILQTVWKMYEISGLDLEANILKGTKAPLPEENYFLIHIKWLGHSLIDPEILLKSD